MVSFLIIAGILYWYFPKKKAPFNDVVPLIKNEPYNYRKVSLELLELAKAKHKKGHIKEAFALSAQSLRLYSSYKYKLKKEISNDELISFLKSHKKSWKNTKEILDKCSLTEFAKFSPKVSDFNLVIKHIELKSTSELEPSNLAYSFFQ